MLSFRRFRAILGCEQKTNMTTIQDILSLRDGILAGISSHSYPPYSIAARNLERVRLDSLLRSLRSASLVYGPALAKLLSR